MLITCLPAATAFAVTLDLLYHRLSFLLLLPKSCCQTDLSFLVLLYLLIALIYLCLCLAYWGGCHSLTYVLIPSDVRFSFVLCLVLLNSIEIGNHPSLFLFTFVIWNLKNSLFINLMVASFKVHQKGNYSSVKCSLVCFIKENALLWRICQIQTNEPN